MFGYTTSFFLFFVAWAILVRHKQKVSFLLALILFLWSFMTHSFLFFYLLPFFHFVVINIEARRLESWRSIFVVKLVLSGALPIIYYLLRTFYWPPIEAFESYHKLTFDGFSRGLIFLVSGSALAFTIFQILPSRNELKKVRAVAITAWGVFAWGIFPYFVNQNLPNTVSVFALRADYGTRHLLLTPLGIGLIVTTIAMTIPASVQKTLTAAFLATFTFVNVFFGTQYLLDSYKKEQLTVLFQETNVVNIDTSLIFVDSTKLFNGRFSTYRNTELEGLINLANRNVKSISGKTTCEDILEGYEIRLQSNKSFYSALLSRDLGLYFEINEC
jgi:hypothetical protein